MPKTTDLIDKPLNDFRLVRVAEVYEVNEDGRYTSPEEIHVLGLEGL